MMAPDCNNLLRTTDLLTIEHLADLSDEYEMGRTVGRGEFAKVKAARQRKDRKLVAIKLVKIDPQQPKRSERLYREISILSGLSHPNIIKLRRVIQLPDHLAIIMEYARGGELFEHVQRKGNLPNHEIKTIMIQLFGAVDYLHQNGIVHRDLKLENVLCDEGGQVYLTDFGFACRLQRSPQDPLNKLLQTACGSPCYAAPELVLAKQGYEGPAADIWSCGVIMYAMAYGYLPFESDVSFDRTCSDGNITWTPANVYTLYQHISSTTLCLPPSPAVDGLSPFGQDLLLKILQPNPVNRITIPEIGRHPWIIGTD